MKKFEYIEHDYTTHYQCRGCGKIFGDRHLGTVILNCRNIRLIGPNNECIFVIDFAKEDGADPQERRSPRFHSVSCFMNTMKDLEILIENKYKNPLPEDIR